MIPSKMLLRLVQIVILILIIMYFNSIIKAQVSGQKLQIGQRNTKHDEVHEVSLGVVFEQHSEEIQEAFKFAMVQYSNNMNKTRLDFQLFVDVINTADAFKLSRLICNQFSRGVVSMLGAVTPDSFDTLHSYTNTFQVPFVTPWFPEKVIPPSGLIDYAISLRPEYHKAIIDTVTHYGWKSIIYVYDSHDGLLRLQQLYQSLQPGKESFRITNVKRVSNATEVVTFLSSLEMLDRWSNKYVVLDSCTKLAKDTLIQHVRDVRLGRRNYHYFLSGLVMDDHWDKEVAEFGAINITGFRVLDLSRKIVQNFIDQWRRESISAQAALMYDAVQVLIDSILRLLRKKPDFLRGTMRRNANTTNSKIIDCNPNNKIAPYEFGERISRMIKRTEMDGLTGLIRFNEAGHRRNFTLQVVEMTVDRDLVKIGTWYDNKGLIPISSKLPGLKELGHYDRNKTYIVATIIEEPYISRNTDYDNDNSQFKGFCVDLTYLVLEKLEITFEIRLVKDNNYGNENPKMIGGWDGLVGELVRKEVDLVIAPLTVNVEREQIIDFSKPFLSFDVKTEKNPSSDMATIFSFLRPLSREIWLCVLGSIFSVSVCLFVVSRFSPNEWRVMSYTDSHTTENNEIATTRTTVVNEFSFWNSLWFSLGSFMQQGSDITPRSLSGRIVSVVWCFFALILISIYTANMASYLTMTRINEPLHTYTRVTTCPADYIKRPPKSTTQVQEDLWMGFISTDSFLGSDEVKKPCEMLVSVTQSGVKDFAIAFPKGSKLRDGVNLALQALRNEGELQQLVRKWFIDAKCSIDSQVHGKELTLTQVAGLFYILIGGLGLALGVALLEFIRHGRNAAARANISLRNALRAKPAGNVGVNNISPVHEPPEELDQEQLEWNNASYTGYYTSSSQAAGQEETSLHASFTPV
ncbi:glutamate receptor 1-like [Vanessa tameamea]|uniref:Glutamate receptor 1-like n=1 Tax=Vanessa tameamea TaxID=334116 RepID=A0A8B8IX42_VANTA|nr:glutamate receptor 1-like [Vanessa tameamea]